MKRDDLHEKLEEVEELTNELVDEMDKIPGSENTLTSIAELSSAAYDARISAEIDRVLREKGESKT